MDNKILAGLFIAVIALISIGALVNANEPGIVEEETVSDNDVSENSANTCGAGTCPYAQDGQGCGGRCGGNCGVPTCGCGAR
ncbi:MAG: hypothetical protein ACLFPQ_02860 [Candidatus Woesearchaeota archaeon]